MFGIDWPSVFTIAFSAGALYVLIYIGRQWPAWFPATAMERERVGLLERIHDLEQQQAVLWELLGQAHEQIAMLRRQLEDGKVIAKLPAITSPIVVLALWPNAPGQSALDQQGESDALYNAGYAYTALRGERCNRAGVILEIDRIRPTVIQVGGHGSTDGILLSDGVAEPGWWGNVVSGKAIRLMVLLSCDTSAQDEINVSDALIRAGVEAVISCDSKIGDAEAVKFAELLYAKLADGLDLQAASRRAALGVSRRAAEMIRLRERR